MTLSQSALSELLDAIHAGGSADVAEAKSFRVCSTWTGSGVTKTGDREVLGLAVVDQIFLQWPTGKLVKAVTSALASASMAAATGKRGSRRVTIQHQVEPFRRASV